MNGILEEEDAMRECKRTGCTAYPTRRVPGRIAAERAGPPNMHVKQIPPDHSSRSADSEWKIDGGGKCKRREEEEVAWVATGQEDERWVGQENWRRMRRMCIRRRKLQLQRQARAHVQLSGCHCLCLCHCLCRCFCLWIHIQPLSNHRRRTIPRRPASTALDSAVTPGPGVARTAYGPLGRRLPARGSRLLLRLRADCLPCVEWTSHPTLRPCASRHLTSSRRCKSPALNPISPPALTRFHRRRAPSCGRPATCSSCRLPALAIALTFVSSRLTCALVLRPAGRLSDGRACLCPPWSASSSEWSIAPSWAPCNTTALSCSGSPGINIKIKGTA